MKKKTTKPAKVNNHNIDMKNDKMHLDFQSIWDQRKCAWQEKADSTIPDEATILRMAEIARHHTEASDNPIINLNTRHRHRWIPYAAAALLIIGIVTYGLTREEQPDNMLPVAEEVSVEGQTFHFLCNKGCSANEVLIAASEVINK
jgi:hypothetical protein